MGIADLGISLMGQYAKFVVAMTAAMVIFFQMLSHGALSKHEWMTFGIAVLAAIGVWGAPNKPPEDHDDAT